MRRKLSSLFFSMAALLLCFTICACGGDSSSSGNGATLNSKYTNQTPSGNKDTSNNAPASSTERVAGTRGSTLITYIGSADGTETYGNDSVIIDASHKSDGYIMINYTGSNAKVKFQLTGPDQITYTYNLGNGFETFPLTSGSGT